MSIKKGTAPPRYDEAFKEGAIKLVTEQGRQSREVAAELGICVETLRSWLKSSGVKSGVVDRENREARRVKELEAQNRELRRQLAEKEEVIDVLKKSVGILLQAMSRKGDPYDNAVAENFFSCLKCECVYLQHFATRSAAKNTIFRYIEAYYNNVRPHSSIGWLSPVKFEVMLLSDGETVRKTA